MVGLTSKRGENEGTEISSELLPLQLVVIDKPSFFPHPSPLAKNIGEMDGKKHPSLILNISPGEGERKERAAP